MKTTIAQQLNIKDFPFEIEDKNGHLIYCEYSDNAWWRREYDSDGREKFYEDSRGEIRDSRPKETIIVNGVKYKRVNE